MHGTPEAMGVRANSMQSMVHHLPRSSLIRTLDKAVGLDKLDVHGMTVTLCGAVP